MSDMKCPFCGEKIEHIKDGWCNCKNRCTGSGSISLWQELIRTRKALDVAVGALKDCEKILKADRKDWGYLTAKVALNQIEALAEITALEQKEHFADASKKIEQKEYNDDNQTMCQMSVSDQKKQMPVVRVSRHKYREYDEL